MKTLINRNQFLILLAFVFLVAADVTFLENEISQFNGTLIRSFALFGLGLILAIFIQVRIGLQPLKRVSQSLASADPAANVGTAFWHSF